MIEATSANENTLHRSKISTILIPLIGHLPRSSHQELCVRSLPERAPIPIHPGKCSSTHAPPTPGLLHMLHRGQVYLRCRSGPLILHPNRGSQGISPAYSGVK